MRTILGTMTFGQQVFLEDAKVMTKIFVENGHSELDTAYVYNDGKSEKIIGEVINVFDDVISISTKANPRITGKLDGYAVESQLKGSLSRMNVDNVDIFYLHFPDYKTPIDFALEACAKAYDAGKFKEFGLSNFPSWMVADIYHKCKQAGYMLPRVYEGVYNALSRDAETELFDALETYGIRFYAYNPLAGGILSGKYSDYDEQPSQGRFALRDSYRTRYWNCEYFKATKVIKKQCDYENIEMTEAALRWLVHHSKISSGKENGIIIGASTEEQLRENLKAVKGDKLPDKIIDAFNEGWEICKPISPKYFKYYGR